MFGSSKDEIAREYQRILEGRRSSSKNSIKKIASAEVPVEEPLVDEDDAASFLLPEEDNDMQIREVLDSDIESMSKYTDNMSDELSDSEFADEVAHMDEADEIESFDLDDSSKDFKLDAEASRILNGLGKVAGDLRLKGQNFEADIVEATAMSIKDDYVKEAFKKASIVGSLRKVAKQFRDSGDSLSSDMVVVTIKDILRK